MTGRTISTSRRSMLFGLAIFALPLGLAAKQAEAQEDLRTVNYSGNWQDGRTLVETVCELPETLIITRQSGGDHIGTAFQYHQTGSSLYVSDRSHQVIVTGPTSFTWVNSGGGNRVIYVGQF